MAADKSQKTALITGASGGIGCDLTKQFAQDGYNLVLVARNQELLQTQAEELKAKYGIAVTVLAKDLGRPQAPQEIYRELQKENIRVDALVNNAGFGIQCVFGESSWDKHAEMLQVNILALSQLTRLFLPAMLARKEGKILNVASIGAFMPGPFNAAYQASKSYVLSFSEALAGELDGTGVTVTCLCPGPTATGFQARAFGEDAPAIKRMTSAEVAGLGYQAMQKGERVLIPGFGNRMIVRMSNMMPRKVLFKQYRKLYSPSNSKSKQADSAG